MMLLLRSRCKLFNVSLVSRPFPLYSTKAPVDSSELHNRVLKVGDPKTSIAPVLNQWIKEGKNVTPRELKRLIDHLSYFKRYTHALQVSDWMNVNRKCVLSPGAIAKRVSLIYKVHGLNKAESFIRGIPDNKMDFKVYSSILSCYVEHKSLEKAEATMEKIKQLHPDQMTACNNMMLKLYAQQGKYEKTDRLMQEMKENDVCNGATYNLRLSAYVAARDVDGIERLLMQMKADPMVTVGWHTYSTAAKGYLKAGNVEKALAALKKSEGVIKDNECKPSFESLAAIYTSIGKKDEVLRLWNRIKDLDKVSNSSYLYMLSSLVKLDDIGGAEKIFAEWESEHKHFDTRIPNLMITALCKRGLLDKADAYIKKLEDSGNQLSASTWGHLAVAYHVQDDMEKAVQTMKNAITLPNQPGWKPRSSTFVACIKYLKEKLDLKSALEFLKLSKDGGHISDTTYDGLVSYAHGEIPDTEPLDLFKRDNQTNENVEP